MPTDGDANLFWVGEALAPPYPSAVFIDDANHRRLLRTSKPINWVIDQPPNVRITGLQHPDRGTIGGSRADRDYPMSTHVHDDDIAGFEHGHELLFDIGPEALAVDRSVEDARRREPVDPQSAEEGQHAPVAMRGEAAQALSSLPPAPQRCHIGLDPCLVDEDQLFRIKTRLPRAPAFPPSRDVGAGLLKGEQRFLNRRPSRRRNCHTVSCDTFTPSDHAATDAVSG